MTQAIKIRMAGAEELGEVENLVKAAYREFQPLMPAAAWNGWMDDIRETIQAPEGVLLVAGDQGRIQGAVKFYPDAGQAHQGQWPAGAALIRLLAVAPASRGRGYGRLLTQACLDRARSSRYPPFSCSPGPLWPRPASSMKNWVSNTPRNLTGTRGPSPTGWTFDYRAFFHCPSSL